MSNTPLWASESLWRKVAIFVTAGSFIILIFLTLNSLSATDAGTSRVPAYDVINKRIDYQFDAQRQRMAPVIGKQDPLFGKVLSQAEAEALVTHGKKTIQAKNCMDCHTLLGNGAYYAPDLTKAWLDPGWGSGAAREMLMTQFLMDPTTNARTYGSNRRMPRLGITQDEARAVVAFLKWMSSIDTNGFPANFKTISQGD